jgi:hypothetical protein
LQTRLGQILFFGLHPTKEILWQSPEGVEARKVIIYLQNSVYLRDINITSATGEKEIEGVTADVDLINESDMIDSGSTRDINLGVLDRVADLCGDAKSLGVVLENGTILSFSWAAKVRRKSLSKKLEILSDISFVVSFF